MRTYEEMYGPERAVEIKKKQSDTHKAIPHTPEWNENSAKANRGKKRTPEFCKMMSDARIGIPRGPRTPEHQANMVKAQRARIGNSRSCLRGDAFNVACLERDSYACQACGITQEILTATKKGMSSYLQVHHIKPIEEYPEFQFDIENGVTYCPPCHSRIEVEERRKNLILILDCLEKDVFALSAAYGVSDIEGINEQLIINAEQSVVDLLRIMRISNLKKQLVSDVFRAPIQKYNEVVQ